MPGQDPWNDSVMMVFGNVFAFNAPLVQNMKREWGTIGQVTRLEVTDVAVYLEIWRKKGIRNGCCCLFTIMAKML